MTDHAADRFYNGPRLPIIALWATIVVLSIVRSIVTSVTSIRP